MMTSGLLFKNASWEYVEIDFGAPKTFNRVIFWGMQPEY
jgi:hypothetical protein